MKKLKEYSQAVKVLTISLKTVGENAFQLPDFFSSSKSITACQAFYLTRCNKLHLMYDYIQYFCSAAAEPASQEREHKLANKSCFQNYPNSCDDIDRKYFLVLQTHSCLLLHEGGKQKE